jgi:hypothetical protein
MQIEANLLELTPLESGTSKAGKDYVKCLAIVETLGQYPKKIAIELFGTETIEKVTELRLGQSYKWDVNVESRESNGKWYTTIKLWRVQ